MFCYIAAIKKIGMNKTIFLIALLFSYVITALGQSDREDRIGVGLGPAKLYGDNTGIHSQFKFRVLPALSADYTKVINNLFDIKATIGTQLIQSGDFYNYSTIEKIAIADLPHAFSGTLFFGDIMPIVYLNPDKSGYLPALVKVYTGVGLGYFYSTRRDTKRTITATGYTDRSYNASNSGVYLPIRLGAYKELKSGKGEIGLEGTMMYTLAGQMEGNDQQQKRIKQDIAMQLQFFYRIPIGK